MEKIYSEQKYELEQLRLKQLQALDKQAMDIGNHWFEEMKKVEEKSLIEIEVKVTEILDLSDKLNNLTVFRVNIEYI